MVINDDRDLLETYEELITQMGHEAVTKVAVDSADVVRETQPEALVVDLQRAGEDEFGLRVVEDVRADPGLRALPIVVCTGAAEPQLQPVRRRLAELGVPVLPKPFTLQEFEAALDALLSNGPGQGASGPGSG
jgi:CheY-like chemotaxis protein